MVCTELKQMPIQGRMLVPRISTTRWVFLRASSGRGTSGKVPEPRASRFRYVFVHQGLGLCASEL